MDPISCNNCKFQDICLVYVQFKFAVDNSGEFYHMGSGEFEKNFFERLAQWCDYYQVEPE